MLREVVLTFESVDEIRKCDHSNESYWAVLSCGAVYYILCSMKYSSATIQMEDFQSGRSCLYKVFLKGDPSSKERCRAAIFLFTVFQTVSGINLSTFFTLNIKLDGRGKFHGLFLASASQHSTLCFPVGEVGVARKYTRLCVRLWVIKGICNCTLSFSRQNTNKMCNKDKYLLNNIGLNQIL